MPVKEIVKKNELDQFYTNPNVATYCLSLLRDFAVGFDFFVEPSAGTGSFFKQFKRDCFGFDLDPKCDGVVKQDWYKVSREDLPPGSFCIVGNPPFGARNSDSKGFIQHSINLGAEMIAFVLPEVFEKHTLQKVFPKDWNLLKTEKLPKDSFILNETPYHVPCVFQIWSVRDFGVNLREVEPVLENDWFEYVKHSDNPDIFVFGAAPTKTLPPSEVLPNNRGYYLKLKVPTDSFLEKLNSINWKTVGKSSANGGVFWLTKGEFVNPFK